MTLASPCRSLDQESYNEYDPENDRYRDAEPAQRRYDYHDHDRYDPSYDEADVDRSADPAIPRPWLQKGPPPPHSATMRTRPNSTVTSMNVHEGTGHALS